VEPRTSALSELRSSQLSYTPFANKKAKPDWVWPVPPTSYGTGLSRFGNRCWNYRHERLATFSPTSTEIISPANHLSTEKHGRAGGGCSCGCWPCIDMFVD